MFYVEIYGSAAFHINLYDVFSMLVIDVAVLLSNTDSRIAASSYLVEDK